MQGLINVKGTFLKEKEVLTSTHNLCLDHRYENCHKFSSEKCCSLSHER